MSLFRKYRKYYQEPERYTPDIARERRLVAALEKERQFAQAAALSRVQLKEREQFVPKWKLDEEPSRKVPKAVSITAALSRFKESDFADPARREQYKQLRRLQEQQRAKPSGGDRRRYSPYGNDYASTISGTVARVGATLGRHLLPRFRFSYAVIPCIQRAVRREVMFANGKGGRGYKVPHRRSPLSGIPC